MTERDGRELSDVIRYAVNSEKTQQAENEDCTVVHRFVSGINCSPATARDEMLAVKKRFGKENGTVAYHGYQSFAPGEVTPETAHEIGMKLAARLWGDRYQVIVATHLDKENHLHNHFVLNTVSFVDGIKYHRTKKDYHDNIKHVYDISQTTSRMRAQPPVSHDARALLGALIYKKPVPIQSVDELPDGLGALYDHEQEAIFVCRGMEANDLFCEVSKALAQAELAQTGEEYDPQTASFKAHCVSYILGKEFGVDVSDYSFENPADFLRTDDPQEIRTELSEIRDTAYDISARMARALEKEKSPRHTEQER